MTIIVKSSETSKTLFTFNSYVQNAEQNKKQFYFIHKYIHWNHWRESVLPSIALYFSIAKCNQTVNERRLPLLKLRTSAPNKQSNSEHWNLSSTAPTVRSMILTIIIHITYIIYSIMSSTDFWSFVSNKTKNTDKYPDFFYYSE